MTDGTAKKDCPDCHGYGSLGVGPYTKLCDSCDGEGSYEVSPPPEGFVERCDADEGGCEGGWDDRLGVEGPCTRCLASMKAAEKDARRSYATASSEERDPEGYRRDMIDGGRGHLLRDP